MSSILAYFSSRNMAQKAKEVLESQGIGTIQIDRISEVPAQNAGENDNPVAAQINSIETLINTGDNHLGANVGPLIAAYPAAIGFGQGKVGSRNILMKIDTSQDKIKNAVQIIKQHKGMV